MLLPYLSEAFPGLNLNPPLFYRWRPGLRFDLGGRSNVPGTADFVLDRAAAVFNAVFPAGDPCLVVAQDWPSENRHPRLAGVLPLFAFSHRDHVGLDESQGQAWSKDEEDPELPPYTLTWVEQATKTFREEQIFEALANADHGLRPAISSRVYCINRRRRIIFHMYDDRGLDLIASDLDTLRPFYSDFHPWILGYDRDAIDQTFAIKDDR